MFSQPTDDYYTKCVNPKPLIPPSYPGASGKGHRQAAHHQEGQTRQAVHRQVGHRQAGHLRSYKDLGDSDDDDDKDEVVVVDEYMKNSPEGIAECDFNSNVSQINFEMDDFNKTYCDESSPWQGESSSSQQWRLNVNRPQPNAGQKSNVKSRLDLGCKNRWQKRNGHKKSNWNRNNCNRNNPGASHSRGQQQASMEQRMRNAYRSFSANPEQSSANVLMNHKYNLQSLQQQPPEVRNTMGFPSSITSLVDSVSNLSDNRAYNRSYARYETTMPSLIDYNVAGGASNPIDALAPENCSAQQVAQHIMLMMSAVQSNDQEPTPEYFKVKSLN